MRVGQGVRPLDLPPQELTMNLVAHRGGGARVYDCCCRYDWHCRIFEKIPRNSGYCCECKQSELRYDKALTSYYSRWHILLTQHSWVIRNLIPVCTIQYSDSQSINMNSRHRPELYDSQGSAAIISGKATLASISPRAWTISKVFPPRTETAS